MDMTQEIKELIIAAYIKLNGVDPTEEQNRRNL